MGEASPQAHLEIRVHGIGDHKHWSALGDARLLEPPPGTEPTDLTPDIALPPVEPSHQLRLVAWTRTQTRLAGTWWYVGLPFTLVNAAGHMEPAAAAGAAPGARPPGRRRHGAIVALVGALLTVAVYVWLVAIVETVLRAIGPHCDALMWLIGPLGDSAVAVGLGLLLAVGLLQRRWLTVSGRATPTRLTLLNAGAVLAAMVALVTLRPAQIEFAAPRGFEWLTTRSVSGDGVFAAETVDPLVTFTLATLAATVVATLVLTAMGVWPARRSRKAHAFYDPSVERRNAAASAGAGMALLVAAVLVHTVGSAVRLFLDNLTRYLVGHVGGTKDELVASELLAERVALPRFSRDSVRSDFAVDLLPLVGALFLASLVIAFLLVSLAHRRGLLRDQPTAAERQAQVARHHRVVRSLPWTLPLLTVATAALLVISTVWTWRWVLAADADERLWQCLVVAIQGLSIIIPIAAISGLEFGPTRKVLRNLADIAGFWPAAWHPFAAASYRDPVIAAIRGEFTRPAVPPIEKIALVGHSQGSVLAAWALAGPGAQEPPASTLLVTCGSPLSSLYATFFPSYFGLEFFSRFSSVTSVEPDRYPWVNFWRPTDPISTPMLTLGAFHSERPAVGGGEAESDGGVQAEGLFACDYELADPWVGENAPVKREGHSNYWVVPEQVAATTEFF